MIDFVRNILGIRKKRRALPVTGAPKIGATIIRNGVKIKVAQPCDDELWNWLLLRGWRVNPVRNDRRAAIMLPVDTLGRLRTVGEKQRDVVLASVLSQVGKA